MKRRDFLVNSATAAAGFAVVGNLNACKPASAPATSELFKISLAEWSVNSLVFGNKIQELGWVKFADMLANDYETLMAGNPMTNLDFPKFARKNGIEAVEFVNTCFFNKAENNAYLTELKGVVDGEGIKSLLIMCDAEGEIGNPDADLRMKSVENHYKWVDAAAFLGCHSIRVNAASSGTYEEQMQLAADGLFKLCEYADKAGINVLVENHGGLSSNGQWLSGVMKSVNHPRVGTLPDFGNFTVNHETGEQYDRYLGVSELMPYAKAVSAKSTDFNEQGDETNTDYFKTMKIVLDAGYRGYVGIEFEGTGMSQPDGIIATKKLLERVRDALQRPVQIGAT
ncbi:MAG: sugar phosphate isomerase/epimerase family protein [Cyclobacteriaceae bacterium]|nr:sugar phosphate isomerase/epimerase family protein [Cyclobacteriaceae bacterium]